MARSGGRAHIAAWTLAYTAGAFGCGSHDGAHGAQATNGFTSSGGSTNSSGAGSTTGVGSGSVSGTREAGPGSAGGTCLGSSVLGALGKSRLLIGVSTDDTTAAEAPFDFRYIYLAGGLFDSSAPCTSCNASCTASGTACSSGCAWWGCYDSPVGSYAGDFISSCTGASSPAIPMFTYYEILQTAAATFSNFQEGQAEATQAATSVSLMTRYFADWRLLLQQIGQQVALLHIEPDFWGYARLAGSATVLQAAVATANPTDCASMPNTIGGMGQCMISMVRKYAPHALVGLHASAWNIASNTDSSVDVTADANSTASFLAACGQSGADFVVVETGDRDAGYYQTVENEDTWWDPTDATLPSYKQDLTWIQALTEALGTPALYWQTPLGNASQNNTTGHYQDNRVDYFFGGNAAQVESGPPVLVPAHWSDLAAAHVIGVAFGAGGSGQTTPATDDGNLIAKTNAYISGGGQSLCP